LIRYLSLRDNLKHLRLFLLKRILPFVDKDMNKAINQPPRPGSKYCKNQIIYGPCHPLLQKGGETFANPFISKLP
jgi:hypothetical protein